MRINIYLYIYIYTYRYSPDSGDLHHGFGSGVEAAVLYGVADGDVSVQRDGTQVHDGGGGEQHVQVDPDRTQSAGERPGVVWSRWGGGGERRNKGDVMLLIRSDNSCIRNL